MHTILSTTYFGPIEWYSQLYRSDCVYLEACETFQKQTVRNRCTIATANGRQTLSLPVVHDDATMITDIRISNHGKWRTEHWNALASAYGESPFFDYYADDIKPFFTNQWEHLFDFNLAIMRKMLELLDIEKDINLTAAYRQPSMQTATLQEEDTKKGSIAPFEPKTYYQVFQQKHGFMPNLSILDLLFNMGNEAILYL